MNFFVRSDLSHDMKCLVRVEMPLEADLAT